MESVTLSKGTLKRIIAEGEKLVSDVETLASKEQDAVARQRISEIKKDDVQGISELELGHYLRSRGANVD